MNRWLTNLLFVFVALIVAADASAQRSELDDKLSPRQDYALELNWGPEQISQALTAMFAEDDASLPLLTGYLRDVEVRLNTSEFVGERVRIFMSVPRNIAGNDSGATLELDFRARGDFESGSMRPGQEALIYEGLLDKSVLSGAFDFAISMSSSGAAETFDFELRYEIELLN